MLLTVIRDEIKKDYTGGVLLVDGKEFSRTIEPAPGWGTNPSRYPHDSAATIIPHRGINASLKGGNQSRTKGCIPMGWYKIQVSYSPKFKRVMPLLELVPGFEGIRIHAGLEVWNTTGCICVGERWREDKLTKILTEAQNRHEEIYICIGDRDYVRTQLQEHKKCREK